VASIPVAVETDESSAAQEAAQRIAKVLREAVAVRGVASLALSGGTTPEEMLRELAVADVPWGRVHVLQSDERVLPEADPNRNLALIHDALLIRAPIPADHVHAMPVEDPNLDRAAERYERVLRDVADGVLDVVHLGLGDDGHTASLVPDDPVLDIDDRLVAPTQPYRGCRRLTLTYPALSAARHLVWLVQGAVKAASVRRLVAGDPSIPAGRVARAHAVLVCDASAMAMSIE
jgi:6-phosphogluconolactonase